MVFVVTILILDGTCRRIHRNYHEAIEQETASELFPARDPKCDVYADCIYVRNGSNRE